MSAELLYVPRHPLLMRSAHSTSRRRAKPCLPTKKEKSRFRMRNSIAPFSTKLKNLGDSCEKS